MSREQIVRDTAYAIWEAEGKPDGRAAQHWRQAEAHVAASLDGRANAPLKGEAQGRGKSDPGAAGRKPGAAAAAKPPAKTSASKANKPGR